MTGDGSTELPDSHEATPRDLSVLVAAIVSGFSGYAVLVLIARHLSIEENSDFLVFWGLIFGCFGVLGGLLNETTRAVYSAERDLAQGRPPQGPRVLAFAAVAAVTLVIALLLSGLLWAPVLLGDTWPPQLVALAWGVGGFAIFNTLGGIQLGRSWVRAYAGFVATDGGGRLVLVIGAVLVGPSVTTFSWATAIASFGWLAWLAASPRLRRSLSARADVPVRRFCLQLLNACGAAAATAILVVGFPVLIRATSTDEVYALSAPLVLAVSLSRAPLLVPLGAYQGVAVTRVIAGGLQALRPAFLVIAGASVLGSAGAYVLGPAVLHIVNPHYDVSSCAFALLFVAGGLLAVLTLTGAACLALDRHGAYSLGWIIATTTAVAVLLTPLDLTTRTLLALNCGPVVGVAVQVAALRRRGPVAAATPGQPRVTA